MRICYVSKHQRLLHNFKPPATDEEIHASSLQFVRKLSGFTRPSKANQIAFSRAVDQVADRPPTSCFTLLSRMLRRAIVEVEALRARARAADRFHASDERRATCQPTTGSGRAVSPHYGMCARFPGGPGRAFPRS